MQKLFGTDGIRGKANHYPMDTQTAMAAGRAIATRLITSSDASQNTRNTNKPYFLIGRDTRVSGDMLVHAVASGICSAGVDVAIAGVLPTPALAYLTASSDAAAGIVISASHNPFEDNGIKVFDSTGIKLSDDEERRIEETMAAPDHPRVPSDAIGRQKKTTFSGEQYLNYLIAGCAQMNLNQMNLKKMTIILDCANGAAYQLAPLLFRRLGATVVPLFDAPDGLNINDHCGSQHPEELARVVVRQRADIGLAFDGDGDRLIAVDENGAILTGDHIMAVCAQDLKESGRLRNSKVVTTVMSNIGFHKAMAALGIDTLQTDVGDRHVMQKMQVEDAVLGGENSGHIIFRDIHTTGDGLLAGLRLLAALNRSGKPLSELATVMTVFPQKLINVDVRHKPDLETIDGIKLAVKQVQSELGDQGRVLIRYSGTQDKCRVMVEGPTMEKTLSSCKKIAAAVRSAIG